MMVERERAIRDFVPEDYLEVGSTRARRSGGRRAGGSVPGALRGDARRQRARAPSRRPRARRGHRGARQRPDQRDAPGVGSALASARRRACTRYARREARAPAAALRSHRAAAPRQPPLRLLRQPHAGAGAASVRGAQADQLSAHRQPPPQPRRRARRCREIVEAMRAPYESAARAGHGHARRSARASSTTPGHRPPRHHPHRQAQPPRAAGSDEHKIYDLVCGACSRPGRATTLWAVTSVRLRDRRRQRRTSPWWTATWPRGNTVLEARLPAAGREDAAHGARRASPSLPGLQQGAAACGAGGAHRREAHAPAAALHRGHAAHRDGDRGRSASTTRSCEQAMRERGLGTPATRAAIIETLLARGYVGARAARRCARRTRAMR